MYLKVKDVNCEKMIEPLGIYKDAEFGKNTRVAYER